LEQERGGGGEPPHPKFEVGEDGRHVGAEQRVGEIVVDCLQLARVAVAAVGDERLGHLAGLEYQIDEAGGDCARRQAWVRRCLRRLGNHQPALGLDRANARRALGLDAGQHDGGPVGALVGRQRPEQAVDRPAQRASILRPLDAKPPFFDCQRVVWRDDVDMVAHERLPIARRLDHQRG